MNIGVKYSPRWISSLEVRVKSPLYPLFKYLVGLSELRFTCTYDRNPARAAHKLWSPETAESGFHI